MQSNLKRISLALWTIFLLGLFPQISDAFRNLGIPVREAVCWNSFFLKDRIYLTFGQYEAPLFLLSVHPETGETRQFKGPLPSEMGSWGFTLDRQKRIYVGTYYGAHLQRFDTGTEAWEDLGRPAGEKESFVCALTTSPDGKIWGGTFPSAKLFSYDPETGQTEDYGRMDPEQFYCYPLAGEDGLIYCAIQFQKIDIVAFDPKTRIRVPLITPKNRRPGRVNLMKGGDGKIYARLSTPEQWFRIEGERLTEVSRSDVVFPKGGLPDGRQYSILDSQILKIRNPATQEEKEFSLRYDASGAFVFVVGNGPDGRIYGSSMLPLRFFVYDPEKDILTNLGRASLSSGEVYSLGFLDGKLYLCSYPGARLTVYDPGKPLRFGEDEDSNPRDLGPMGAEQDRPRAILAGPHRKIYIGSYPDYGLLGGAISVYDPEKNEKRVYRHIVSNQSIASLAFIGPFGLIAAGSSIYGGGGTRATEKEARLILWDPKEEAKVFEVTPVPEAKTVLSLASSHGIVYGITNNEKIFVFDPEKREVKKVLDLPFKAPREISLQSGLDGKLYGLSREAIFSIDPKTDEISLLAKPPVPITSGMAITGRKIYFGSGPDLWEFEIPLPAKQAE